MGFNYAIFISEFSILTILCSLLSLFFILSMRSYSSGIEFHNLSFGKHPVCALSLHAPDQTKATENSLSHSQGLRLCVLC